MQEHESGWCFATYSGTPRWRVEGCTYCGRHIYLVFLDEHLQICKLPKYVADSPDAMSSVRLYEGDLAALMKILTKLENEVKDLHTAMATITKGLEHRPASQSFPGYVINRHTDIDGPVRVQPGSAGAGNANEMTSRDSHQRHRGSESVSEKHINRDWLLPMHRPHFRCIIVIQPYQQMRKMQLQRVVLSLKQDRGEC